MIVSTCMLLPVGTSSVRATCQEYLVWCSSSWWHGWLIMTCSNWVLASQWSSSFWSQIFWNIWKIRNRTRYQYRILKRRVDDVVYFTLSQLALVKIISTYFLRPTIAGYVSNTKSSKSWSYNTFEQISNQSKNSVVFRWQF